MELKNAFRLFENTKYKILFLITDGDNNIGQDPYNMNQNLSIFNRIKNIKIEIFL